MNELQKKLQERWKERRSKAGSWTKLLVMVFILAALLFFVQRFTNTKNIDWKGSSSKLDTVRVQP